MILDDSLDIRIEESVKKDQQKRVHQRLIGKILPHENHIIWKYDINKQQLTRAEFMKNSTTLLWKDYISGNYKRKSILIEQDCIYFNALNKKNAIKVLKRDYGIKTE